LRRPGRGGAEEVDALPASVTRTANVGVVLMRVLRQSGQPMSEVLLLQRLLNRRLSPSPKLKETGFLAPGPRQR